MPGSGSSTGSRSPPGELILDARTAHAAGDHQRADKLLGDARQLDPRMPAIWDGDLDASLPARPVSPGPAREAPASDPHQPPTANRLAARADAAAPQPGISAQAGRDSSRPSWPSSPARSYRTATRANSGGGQPVVIDAVLKRSTSWTSTRSGNRGARCGHQCPGSRHRPGTLPVARFPWHQPEPTVERASSAGTGDRLALRRKTTSARRCIQGRTSLWPHPSATLGIRP